MKKLIILLFLVSLTRGAIADFTTGLGNPDNKHALDSIVKTAETNKSRLKTAYVFRYNVSRLNTDKVAAELLNDYQVKMFSEASECSYTTIIGSRENIAALRTDNIDKQTSDRIASQLEELDDQGQLMNIVSALWDGKNGSSTLCSAYEFDVFSVDGYKLILEFK